jgi:hypothetical protein
MRTFLLGNAPAVSGMPHPFWIAVLLMSTQYGVMGGLLAAALAAAGFFMTGLPPQSASQDFYAYAAVVAAQPCAWFGIALVLGGLRTLHIHHQATLEEQLEEARQTAEHLTDGLERALNEIAQLETRIAVDTNTLAGFDEGIAKLSLRDRLSLAASAPNLIQHAVGALSFTLYLEGANGLQPACGMENGVPLTPAALASLPSSVRDEMRRGRPEQPARWAPIRAPDQADQLGLIVCTRLLPSQDPTIAARRLNGVCHLLALLLSACPERVL